MEKSKKGFLITLEGGEGGGKTTQSVRLKDYLTKMGKDVVVLREPGGTVISEQIREVVLSTKNKNISFTAEVLLYQAARAQIYYEVVLPSLKAGKIVVIDRSRDSSVVYQGVLRGFGKEMIENLNNISTKNTYPDLTILLDVDVEVGLRRRKESGVMNRFELESSDFHRKVRQAYLDLAKKDKYNRWYVVDANQSMQQVEKDILQVVAQKIK